MICRICNKEFSYTYILFHINTYHNDLTEYEKTILYASYLAKPIKYFNKEVILYMYEHNIVSSLTDFINLIRKRFIYSINTFFTTKSKFKPIELNDIDIYFNIYLPYKKKHSRISNSKDLAIKICGDNVEEGLLFYEKIIKPKNPFLGHGGELSPFSKEYIKYKNMTDEEKRIAILQHNNSKLNPNFNNSINIEYYIKQGMTLQEAKTALKDRQSTFSLLKCIKKYGEELGLIRFKQRQLKWLNNFPKKNYSDISQELFWKIYENINFKNCFFATNNNGNKELNIHKNHLYRAETKNSVFLLDFYIPEIKCWILFDGDYWHGEKRGNQKKEKLRLNLIKESIENIRLKRVKERDYKKDPQKVVNECILWINNIKGLII